VTGDRSAVFSAAGNAPLMNGVSADEKEHQS